MRDPLTCPVSIARGPQTTNRTARLEVYLSSHCPNCGEALCLAAEAAATYANVSVHLVDLDLADSSPPEYVVAVPTYVLDGRVISLGNPYPEELFTRLREALG